MPLSFFVVCLTVLVVVLYFSHSIRLEAFQQEAFGMSPGTVDQMNSTRVPGVMQPPILVDGFKDVNAKPDQAVQDAIQAQLAQKAIADMTMGGSFDSEYADA
jgi:hypothetical protein